MNFSSLAFEAKESIREIISVFRVHQLVNLNKVEMGNRILI